MAITKAKAKCFIIDVLYDLAGSVVFAVGLSCFAAPAQIAPGGVSGIAVIFQHLFGVPLGITSFVLNIPLLLLGWRFLGHAFTLKTLKTVFIISVVTNVVELYVPVYQGEPILAALFGGVGVGVGLAAVFQRGSTTGGSDIVSRLIQLRHRHLPIGKIMLLVDTSIVLLSVVVFDNLELGMYAMICIFTTSKITDSMLSGINSGRLMLIISEKNDIITRDIIDRLDRGVTILNGKGGYSGLPKNVLLCAVRINEYPKVNEFIRGRDPEAFIIAAPAVEILGEGFANINDGQIT